MDALQGITGKPVARIFGRLDQSQWIAKLKDSKELKELTTALEALQVLSIRKENPHQVLDAVMKKMTEHDFSEMPKSESELILESGKVKTAAVNLLSHRYVKVRAVPDSSGERKSVREYSYCFVPLLINKLDDFEKEDAYFVLRVLSRVSARSKRADKNIVRAVSRFASRFFDSEDSDRVALALREFVEINQNPESWESVVKTLKRESVSDELRLAVLSGLSEQSEWDKEFSEVVEQLCQTNDPRAAITLIELGTAAHGSRVMQLAMRLLADNKGMLDEVHRTYQHWSSIVARQRSGDDYDTRLIYEIVGALDKLSNTEIWNGLFRGSQISSAEEPARVAARIIEAEKAIEVLRQRATDASPG